MDVIYSGVSVREKRSQTFGPNSIYAFSDIDESKNIK